MEQHPDAFVIAFTALLPLAILVGAALAYPAALFLLARYRRAVLHGMSALASVAGRAARTAQDRRSPDKPLAFVLLDSHAHAATALATNAWRAAAVYAVAVAMFSLVMTAAFLLAGNIATGPLKLLWLFWLHAWPAVLAVNLVAATDRATRLNVSAAYAAVFIALSIAETSISPNVTFVELLGAWIILNGLPTLLLLAFLSRRVRAVGPIVLAFAVLVVLGSQLAVALLGASEANMRVAVAAGLALGLGGEGIFWGTHLVGLAVFAFGAWFLLEWLAGRYARKKISDEMLTLDAMMLLFGMVHSIGLVFEHPAWMASGLVAFGAYKLTAVMGYRVLPVVADPKRLLLLRVFSLGARSEPLFDALRRRWLRAGSITMIAGPDLATSAVEPDEFLSFLSGRLGRQFVAGEADLASRVQHIDRAPDPDHRFRVAEFFCRADTWQPTMRRLMSMSDAVLMDLRSFGRANAGCIYELGELLDAIDLSRVVLLIDRTTDRSFLEQTLAEIWSSLGAESPNRRSDQPRARLFRIDGPTASEVEALLAHLS